MSEPLAASEQGVVVGQLVVKPANASSTDATAFNPYGLQGVEEGNDAVRHPTPIRGFLIAARVLTGLIAATAAGTIAFAAAFIAARSKDFDDRPEEGRLFTLTLTQLFYSLSIVESVLCLAASLTCFGLLFTQQHRVLTRDPHSGPFGCLCASLFILFLCAAYSCGITAAFGDFSNTNTRSVAVIPGIRAVSLLALFGVLVANSQREPFDH